MRGQMREAEEERRRKIEGKKAEVEKEIEEAVREAERKAREEVQARKRKREEEMKAEADKEAEARSPLSVFHFFFGQRRALSSDRGQSAAPECCCSRTRKLE